MKIGKITKEDYIKANRMANREVVGFVPHKVHRSKKAYTRKNYKVDMEG